VKISFIIPAYNEEKLIYSCIRSIFDELNRRDFSDLYEVIVVDNMSTDKTVETVETWWSCINLKVISCNKKGVTHARQAGFEVAEYDIQAYIDADNQIPYGWLDVVEHNLSDLKVAAISGPLYFYDKKFINNLSTIFYKVNRLAKFLIGPSIQGGNFVIRKYVLERMRGHSTDILFYGEDTDLAIRAAKIGKVLLVPDLWILASPRRFEKEGYLKTTWTYVLNYLWIHWFGVPKTKEYKDIRP
jgi:glycosyltransferase involved in cell wall biosynthesis